MVRLLVVAVLAFFTFQSTVAYAAAFFEDDRAGCCPGGDDSDADEEQDSCPCPLECAAGCAGTLRALAPEIAQAARGPALVTELILVDEIEDPPSADPFEVLHVPKPGRA
jgi:hypothetical protein